MQNHRYRPLLVAAVVLLVVWGLAWSGYQLAAKSKVTAEKIRHYLHDGDLSRLTGAERAKAIRKLADMLNALSPEERRTARLDREWRRWFEQMTEQEKNEFIEATLPNGFKQMLAAFEQLPPEKRQRAVNESIKRLKEAQENPALAGQWRPDGQGPPPPPMSEELRQKVTSIGLNAFYTQSSAQTKAELAPLLEEIQHSMESGRLFR